MKAVKSIPVALAIMALTLMVVMYSCQKGSSVNAGSSKLNVYLTDGPAAFDAVNIDVVSVEAKVDTCASHMHDDHHGDTDADKDDVGRHDDFGTWTTLNATPGIYNVLTLRNGIDTLLATGNVTGTVRKIRLTIGTNNTVVKDGVTYPLVVSNETGNYLYIHLRNEHRRDSMDHVGVWVDFDLARSIVLVNGTYYLKPVLKPFCDKNFAEIEGKVTPAAAGAIVKVWNATDTGTAIPNPDGYFKIRGLQAGTYSVLFDASNGYIDSTINNVTVQVGRETKLQPVVLHQ